jgi:ornithine--oxo-acid transaminase
MEIKSLVADRLKETYNLHSRYVNPQFVRVLKAIGFNRNYVSGKGARLTDARGREVLDFLAGFGVFNIGRNHPKVARTLKEMMDLDPPNLIQMDVGCISGLLAEALAKIAPGDLEAVFFTNSGTESVEGALKFARQATKRSKIVYCEHAFHGLTLGSLSVCGAKEFRERNEPLLPGCSEVEFNNLEKLESALKGEDVAAFIVEPIQGKGVFVPDDDYLPGVRDLCDKYGTLLIADEVQTGLGRTGRMFAVEHWGVEPDILVVSKALSGGYIPVGAIITTRDIHGRVFDSMERCYAHSNTFGQNDMAMAAGLAALSVIEEEDLVHGAAERGAQIMEGLNELTGRYEMLGEVRGKGLMIGMQFVEPESMMLKTGWKLLHKMNNDLFAQMITMPLLEKYDILTQVAGQGLDTVKILPPLVITEADADYFLESMDKVLKDAHRFPGSTWTTTKNLAIRTAKSL